MEGTGAELLVAGLKAEAAVCLVQALALPMLCRQ